MSETKARKAYLNTNSVRDDCIICGRAISVGQYYGWGTVAGKPVQMHCSCATPELEPKSQEWAVGEAPGKVRASEGETKSLLDAIKAQSGKGAGSGQGQGQGEGDGGDDKPVMWSEFSPAVRLIDEEITKVNQRVDKAATQFTDLGKTVESIKSEIVSLSKAAAVAQIEIIDRKRDETKRLDTVHFKFGEVMNYVQAGVHCYLYGEKGGGKSTLAKQVAEALGLPFGYISLNPLSSASLLTGFMSANGSYVTTEFRRIYEGGGVFCIDELDNAAANVLTAINGAVANEIGAFADKNVPMHDNFILIGTGNTPLRGATMAYPERRKGDESVMDRLAFIEMPYDKALERKLALMNNAHAAKWVDWIQNIREWAAKNDSGVRGLFDTPRAIINGAKLLRNGNISVESIADSQVFKGLGPDMKKKILKEFPLPPESAFKQPEKPAAEGEATVAGVKAKAPKVNTSGGNYR